MIATHNIKVNGKWVMAGEAYEVEEPRKADETKEVENADVAQEEPAATSSEEPKASPKPRTASTRRKASK